MTKPTGAVHTYARKDSNGMFRPTIGTRLGGDRRQRYSVDPVARSGVDRRSVQPPTQPVPTQSGWKQVDPNVPGTGPISGVILFAGRILAARNGKIWLLTDDAWVEVGPFVDSGPIAVQSETCTHNWAPWSGAWGGLNAPTHTCAHCGLTKRVKSFEGGGSIT